MPTILHINITDKFAPTIVSAKATSSSSIVVYWDISRSDAKSSPIGYVVDCIRAGDDWPSSLVERANPSFYQDIENLYPSTDYKVRVTVVNSDRTYHTSTVRDVSTQPALFPVVRPGKLLAEINSQVGMQHQ